MWTESLSLILGSCHSSHAEGALEEKEDEWSLSRLRLNWTPPSDNCSARLNRMLKKTSQRWCDCKWLFGAQATDGAKCLPGIAAYQSAPRPSSPISVPGPIYKSRYFTQWATQSFITICGESAGVKLAAGGCPYVSCMQQTHIENYYQRKKKKPLQIACS